jgi:hypothetical protein
MAKGKKTGGRQPGSLNMERRSLIERINEKYPDYDPVFALIEIARDKKLAVNIRLQANKEVAKYVHPQLKTIEIKEALTTLEEFLRMTPEERKAKIESLQEKLSNGK